MTAGRDYSSISPSARSLLLVKAQTDLPFARQAADLLFGADAVTQAASQDPAAVLRRAHFELRARSLDEALRAEGVTNILEIAAGLSLRGLAMTATQDVEYVDTDLPELASIKVWLVAQLAQRAQLDPRPILGSLRVQALDALDPDAFRRTVRSTPPRPIAVVHEGLLMYLGEEEKARLAASVREALLKRGGAWITADVYVRSETHLLRDEKTQTFLAEHRVDDKKFADWRAAEAFFTSTGFSIERRLAPRADPWPVRETWTLRARA